MASQKVNIDELCKVRDYKESDKAFVISTWLRGYYYGEKWVSEIPKEIFMLNYNIILNSLLNNKRISVKVACLAEDPDVILAYVAHSHDQKVIHWMFSKAAWRNIGLISKILPKEAVAVSHLTTLGRTLLKKHPQVKFNPFAVNQF